jgi:hypothetical protein
VKRTRVLALLCLTVAHFACTEGVKPTGKVDEVPAPEPSTPAPQPPAAKPPPPARETAVAWGTEAAVGDWRVELSSLDARGKPVRLRLWVGNASATRTLRYPGMFWGGARLRDARGKEYPVFNFGNGRFLQGQATMPVRVPPRSRIEDLVLFRGVARAGDLLLDIEPSVFGKRLRFRIPGAVVKR